MDLYSALVLGHVVGAVLAVGGATLIEVQLNKALADKEMSLDERNLLGADFFTLRIGLLLSLVTGFGFIAYYYHYDTLFRIDNDVFWAKMTLLLLVVINALLLQARKISLYWGSAVSFIGWWGIFFLGFASANSLRYSFLEITIAFVVFLVAGAFLMHKIRELIQKQHG